MASNSSGRTAQRPAGMVSHGANGGVLAQILGYIPRVGAGAAPQREAEF
jgi:hypothetical protein